jgi:hypothetical protein
MSRAWPFIERIATLPLAAVLLAGIFKFGRSQDTSAALLGGWSQAPALLGWLGAGLLLLLAGWLRLGWARPLGLLLLATLAVRLAWEALQQPQQAQLANAAAQPDALLLCLLAFCALALLPAPRRLPEVPRRLSSALLLLLGLAAATALALGANRDTLPPCSFDPHSGRQLSLCLDVAA